MTYHSYIFLSQEKNLHELSKQKLNAYSKEFIHKISQEGNVLVYTYTTVGLKANTTFLLWLQCDNPEQMQSFINALMHTKLGTYLKITYTLFGIVRPTQYSLSSQNHKNTSRKGGSYLIIYPFTKTTDWYMLNFEKRKDLMNGHMAVGRKYPQITQLLLYSYGVDDQEFIVSYETDNLIEFQSLVMELRTDKVREYTLKDTPLFMCIYRPLSETLTFL